MGKIRLLALMDSPCYLFIYFFEFWNLFKSDFIWLFEEFYRNGHVNSCLKENFIGLISKKEKVSKVKDYRPISLTTSVYKILAKVLAERIKKVMPITISRNESAFIKGRQILHPILMANEFVEEYKLKRRGWLLKLDVEKAFNMIDWGFLEIVLQQKGKDVDGLNG